MSTGVEIFEAGEQEKEAAVVGRLVRSVEDVGVGEAETLLREQEASAVSLAPRGGSSEDEEIQHLLKATQGMLKKHEEMDLLESRYDTIELLLSDIYGRLDSGLAPEDLAYCRDGHLVGVIDYPSEEFLCVEDSALLADTEGTADVVGLSVEDYTRMVGSERGLRWLLMGEDPTDTSGWDDIEVSPEEIESLSGMWDTPEVVDEASLPEASAYGKRVKDPKTGRMVWRAR